MPFDKYKICIFKKKSIEKNTTLDALVLTFFYMLRGFIKFCGDFGPLLVFFILYFKNDQNLEIAIPPFIIATIIALIVIYLLEKKIPMVPLISGILITLFGGLTLYFENKIFFYMKPTIINILFAGVIFFGKYFTKKPVLKVFFKNALNLEDQGWKILSQRWILFFIFVAILNEIVWRTQSEVFWVNFKVWGLMIISFIFVASQVPIINKYKLK